MLQLIAMPNKHAAIKDLRKNRKHAILNARLKTHVKSLSLQLETLLKEGKKAEATELSKKLQQSIDKSAKRHIIHANKAGRKVASVHKAIAKIK